MNPHTVMINGKQCLVLDCHNETGIADHGHGPVDLRVLTIDTLTTRYKGAFLLDPTAGDYGTRDREQTADKVTAFEFPMPWGPPGDFRVTFADGSTVAAFMVPDREPVRPVDEDDAGTMPG